MKYLLDTHTWIWWHSEPGKLSKKATDLISRPGDADELLLSSISVWELCKLIELSRIILRTDGLQWIQTALAMNRLRVVPLSPEILWASTTLPGEFHRDPADQIIVATAREESAIIVTKDELISGYRHVRTIW